MTLPNTKTNARSTTGASSELTAEDINNMVDEISAIKEELIATEAIGVSAEGDVGDDEDPEFKFVVQNAGINRAELALYAKSSETGGEWEKVWGTEITGTSASVRDGLRGSHLEGFLRDGYVDPLFRVNSTPAVTLEMAAVGGEVPVTQMSRTGSTVTVNCKDRDGVAMPHGLGVGQQARIHPGEANFASGLKTVVSVNNPDPALATSFTYTEAGSAVSNTVKQFVSAVWDVGIKRIGYQQFGMVIGETVKWIQYADALAIQPDVRLVAAGGLDHWGQDKTSTPGAVTINYPSGRVKIAAGQSSVTVTCDKVGVEDDVHAFVQQASADATLLAVVRTVSNAGSFTIYGNAAATADVQVCFRVFGTVVI